MSTIRNALSASYTDVDNAVKGIGFGSVPLADGDTLKIPPGNVTWTTPLLVSKNIKILGSGQGATNISGRELFKVVTNNNTNGDGSRNTFRLSSMTLIQLHNLTVADSQKPAIRISGNSQVLLHSGVYSGGIRVDQITWKNETGIGAKFIGRCMSLNDYLSGVVDHCYVDHDTDTGGAENNFGGESIIICHEANPNRDISGNIVSDAGSYDWSHDYPFGSVDTIFFEDNIFKHRPFGTDSGTAGGGSGGHYCVRHNTGCCSMGGGHGTETGSTIANATRGQRAGEIYNNLYFWRNALFGTNPPHCTALRAGSAFFANNRYDGLKYYEYSFFGFRASQNIGAFGGSAGYSPWDRNERAATGANGSSGVTDGLGDITFTDSNGDTFVSHESKRGFIYATGTNATGAGGGDATISLPDLPFTTTNDWVGYAITNRTLGPAKLGNPPPFGWITKSVADGSGGTILTIGQSSQGTTAHTPFSPGDRWEIRHVLEVGDAVGAGAGIALTVFPSSQPTDALGLAQAVEGVRAVAGTQKSKSETGTYANTISVVGATGRDALTCRGMSDSAGAYPVIGSPTAKELGIGADWNDPSGTLPPTVDGSGNYLQSATTAYGFVYPHPLVSGVGGVVTPQITSTSCSFTAGVGATFQIAYTGFSATPTFTLVSGSFPSGISMDSGGLITSTGSVAAGTYTPTVRATHSAEVDDQTITITVSAAATKIIALSGSMAFGAVTIGTTATKTLTIANSGTQTLNVSSITFPTGYGVVSGTWQSGTIAAGASKDVTVQFSPISGVTYNGTITVVSDKTSGTNTASATGSGATRVIANGGTLAFGSVTTGKTTSKNVTISNTGNATLTVSGVSYPTGFSGNYSGGTIAAGGSVTVAVTFAPTLVQAYDNTITISSDATSGDNTISVTGSGTAAASKIIRLTGDMNFGGVQTGTSLTKTLSITNDGNTTLTLGSLPTATGFALSYHTGTGTIAAGATSVVDVVFSPVSAIDYSTTLTFSSDATSGTNTAAVTASGVTPSTKIIGLEILELGGSDFGNVNVGTTATRTLTITNTGSALLSISAIGVASPFGTSFSTPVTIDPGATVSYDVTFAPIAVLPYAATLTVTSDATGGTGTIDLTGSGVAIPTRIIGLSGNLAFGNVIRNHTARRNLVIANTGTDTLTISDIVCPTGFSPSFTTAVLAPGTSDILVITFAPTAKQNYGGTIVVSSDKTTGKNSIACSGTGVNGKQAPFFLQVT